MAGEVGYSGIGSFLTGFTGGAKFMFELAAKADELQRDRELYDLRKKKAQWFIDNPPGEGDDRPPRVTLDDALGPAGDYGPTGGGGAGSTGGGGGGGYSSADYSPTSAAGLVAKYESDNRPYLGYGGADLSRAPLDEFGFPQWAGVQAKTGLTHAAGLFQFQPGTWRRYAEPLGIKDFSPESQLKVFNAAYAAEGFNPWRPYNTRLDAALRRGDFRAGPQSASAADMPAPPAVGAPTPLVAPTPAPSLAAGGALPFARAPAAPAAPALRAPSGLTPGSVSHTGPVTPERAALSDAYAQALRTGFIGTIEDFAATMATPPAIGVTPAPGAAIAPVLIPPPTQQLAMVPITRNTGLFPGIT